MNSKHSKVSNFQQLGATQKILIKKSVTIVNFLQPWLDSKHLFSTVPFVSVVIQTVPVMLTKLNVAPLTSLPRVQERLLALKRSVSFMQDMDNKQQAAILGDEDLTADLLPPEITIPVELAKKSRKQPVKVMKEVVRYSSLASSIHAGQSWVYDVAWFTSLLLDRTLNTFPCIFQLPIWTRGKCLQLDRQHSRGACSCTRRAFSRWSSGSDQQIHAQLQGSPLILTHLWCFLAPVILNYYDQVVVGDRTGSMASPLGLMLCMFLSLCDLFADGLLE